MRPGPADEALSAQSDSRVQRERRDRWDELVLPERATRVLQAALTELDARRTELLSAGSERARAHEPRLTLLFAGVRGTGKTLAAQLFADQLGVDIVTVDLVAISALERGEAEKQIGRAVDDARNSRALLAFDRVDALLATASPERLRPVRGSAFEFSELVALGHRYPGVVVFTSWLTPRSAPSLPEGIDFVVEFPLPSHDARKQIWRRQLPPDARVDDDALSFLAGSFFDAGATIRDCCVAATAAAAAEGVPVQMIHIGRALQRQYAKHLVSPRADAALKHLLEIGAAGAVPATRPAATGVAAAKEPAHGVATHAIPTPVAEPPEAPSVPAAEVAPTPAPEPAPAPSVGALALGETEREPAASAPAIAAASEDETAATESAVGGPTIADAPDNEAVSTEATASEALLARIDAALGRLTSPRPSFEPAPAAEPIDHYVAERDRRSSRALKPAVLALVGILLAAGLGFLGVLAIGGGASSTLSKHARAGPVRISFPSDWRLRTVPRADARGLSHAVAVGPQSGARGLLVIGTRHAGSRSRPSRSLRLALSRRSRPKVVTLGDLVFTVSRRTSAGQVYAMPTRARTVFGLCLTSGAAPGFTNICEQILATVTLATGRATRGERADYAAALNRAMRKLGAVGAKAGSELRLAHSPQAQAAAANALAVAHDAAASTLSHLKRVGGARAANSSLAAALRATARAYAALASEAAENDAAGYRNASGAVARANASVQSALQRLRNLGYQVG